ncbi:MULTISPECIES: hypothetical protein [Rhodococcus]|uniref:Uncharacterized protein n=1 Tax=Rhodococcus koreensis TaxID=99653 RepID=A0A1H4TMS5_9NOCA|nr:MULTISPECIES: hypothetical protein [Rhodococcus]SEC57538.1 hypothetical protein SAMN04490239_4599 [Rhodococcus koreensis]
MPSQVSAARRIAVFVVGRHTDPVFTSTGAVCDRYPHLLDADNLREAALETGRLEPDEAGRTPLPLLRIDTTASVPTGPYRPLDGRAVPFPNSPRLLAGLIADARRVGVASGALIAVDGPPALRHRLRGAVVEYLRHAGFDVVLYLPGWVLDEGLLARTS